MQSLLHLPKLFFCGFVATAFVSFFPTHSVAQVYQVRPDGSLINQPRYVNPKFRQYPPPPQIYPGQIINGERVIGASVPAPPLSRGEAVNPPKPTASNSDPKNPNPTQQSQRPKTVSRTNVPIPTGPALKSEPTSKSVADSAPAAPSAVTTETPPISESSFATEEKTEPAEPTEPLEPQISRENPPIEVEMEDAEIPTEDPASPSDPSETPSSTDLPIDEFSSQEAPAEDLPTELPTELPTLGPPTSETPQDDSLLAPPKIDEEIDEDIMAEIKQIRAQLGGGIAETLKEVEQMPGFGSIEITPSQDSDTATTVKEVSPDDLFNEELRSVMSEQQSKGDAIIAAPQTLPSPRSDSSPMQLPNELPNGNRTQELRNCARELEQLAGRLEAIAAYEHADQVRRQAADLWTTARQR